MDLIILMLVLVLVLIGFLVWLLTMRIPRHRWPPAIQVIALIAVILFMLTRIVHIPNVLR